ncbi:MAG: pentapeptide repeat-containing protein [Pseudomonadota bacterium]|nr:pentapeptide repeat-containing protein [Pseudomonadota bacterium]
MLVALLSAFSAFSSPGGVAGFDLGRSCRTFCSVTSAGEAASDAFDLSLCIAAACDLRGTALRGMDLRDKDLQGVDFRNADLRDVSFRNTNLAHANLHGADVRGADFTGAQLTGTNLKSAIFCKTIMPWGIANRDCQKK